MRAYSLTQLGANQPVTVKIGSVASKVAGNYSDNITVTLATID